MLGNDARLFPQMHKESPSQSPNKRFFRRLRRSLEKDERYRNQLFLKRHSKEELQSWDARMREELDNHAEYLQPRQLREQIHSGRLKIKQSANVAMLLKQHAGYHLAAQILRRREQKPRIAGGSPMQEEQQSHPSSSSSHWDDWWTSSWWDESCKWTENPRWFLAKFE